MDGGDLVVLPRFDLCSNTRDFPEYGSNMPWAVQNRLIVRGRLPVLLLLLSLCCGCNTFDKAWAKAEAEPLRGDSMLGCWEGNWMSDVNGHNGSLRCVVTQKSDGTFKAQFHAIYRKVIGFGYTVPLHVSETNGAFHFEGDANLGWWAGGVYHYEGSARETNFFSTYNCKYDHGTFRMSRPYGGMK
jgi:hypothetical protein